MNELQPTHPSAPVHSLRLKSLRLKTTTSPKLLMKISTFIIVAALVSTSLGKAPNPSTVPPHVPTCVARIRAGADAPLARANVTPAHVSRPLAPCAAGLGACQPSAGPCEFHPCPVQTAPWACASRPLARVSRPLGVCQRGCKSLSVNCSSIAMPSSPAGAAKRWRA